MKDFQKTVKRYFLKHSPELYWGDDADCRFWVLNHFKDISKKKILDVGCQVGNSLNFLDPSNCLFGIDINPDYIHEARKNHTKCDFSIGSMFDLPYEDQSFDLVFMLNTLPGWDFDDDVDYHDNTSRQLALDEVHRVLRKGGALVLTTPNVDSVHYAGSKKGSIDVLLPLMNSFTNEVFGWNNVSKIVSINGSARLTNYLVKLLSLTQFFWNYLMQDMIFSKHHSKSIIIFSKK